MSDPIINDEVNVNDNKTNSTIVEQKWSSWIFGWWEDVFDNEELFRPLDWVENKKINSQKKEEDLNLNIDENEIIKNEWETKEEIFDPIFTEETEIKEWEIIKETIDDIPVIDFHKDENEIIKLEIKSENQSNKDDFLVKINDTEKKEKVEIIDNEEINKEIEEIPDVINDDEIKIEKEPEEEKSDLIKKFLELVNKTKELYNIAKMEDGEYVELIGWDTGKSQVIYNLWLIKEDEESDSILISKVETDTETKDQQQNNLQFKDDSWSLEIVLDEQVLYNEIQDLKEDQNKKMQVIDKLNKFIFLISEELKVYERDKKEKERMEQERRKLRDIFRNF